jgi:hypothetical protein
MACYLMTALHALRSISCGCWAWAFSTKTCLVGRAQQCPLHVPAHRHQSSRSRAHWFLDLMLPAIWAQAQGSLPGTSNTGTKLGQCSTDQSSEEAAQMASPEPEAPVSHPGSPPLVCVSCGQNVPEAGGMKRAEALLCVLCRATLPRRRWRGLGRVRRELPPHCNIAGYQVLQELGRGGMGAVYLVRQDQTGERFALKVLLPQAAADERSSAQFLHEMETTRALQHLHVVHLHEGGVAQGALFFTLEYCEGGSVRQLLERRGGTLPIDEAGALILQALAGLQYAHTVPILAVRRSDGTCTPGRGLVHHDVKPANLFLAQAGSTRLVKLGDYGLAQACAVAGVPGQTRMGVVAGTPAYMPRQLVLQGEDAQPEVDVWAMAASLYQLLTGTVPREFGRGRDPWRVVLESDAVPIHRRTSAIPKRLAEVLDHALRDRPEIGFKTAVEFQQALEGAL